MIISVTPNSSIDWTIFIPYLHWNETIRSQKAVWGMAGKPADASWILGELGIKSLAMGFAAGMTGNKMLELFHQKGVDTDFVWVEGETRLNVHLVDMESGGQSLLAVDTLIVKPDHIKEFFEKYEKALNQAEAVVTGGSLPKSLDLSILTIIVQMARERNIPVALDTSGPHIKPGLAGHPNFIKPNRTELSQVIGRQVKTVKEVYAAAREVLDIYGTEVVVTLGDQGALAVLKDRAYRIPAPKVDHVESIAGAGDAVLAGITWALAYKKPIEEGLRLGTAAAGAVVMQPGTADCRKEDVNRLLPTIELIPYQEGM